MYNTADYLTVESSFSFAPYGVDLWKFGEASFVNPFGDDCVFSSGEGLRISITNSVLYMGDYSISTIPQHYMIVADADLQL